MNQRLSEKMQKWELLKTEIDALENDIKSEVLALGKTQKVGNVTATFTNGRRSYDYESIAAESKVDPKTILQYTRPSVDWKTVCGNSDISKDIMEKFCKIGNPSVNIKLTNNDNEDF